MPAKLSTYRPAIIALGKGARRVHIRMDKDLTELATAFSIQCRNHPNKAVITSKTGSRNGQHLVVYTNDVPWIRAELAGIRGLEITVQED